MNNLSKDLIELAEEGELKDNHPKAIYKETDTVEQMARQTADLLADSARRLIASAQKDEKEILNILADKTYFPRRLIVTESVDYIEQMKNKMNLF